MYVPHLHTSRRSLAEVTTGPTRCIAFLSDRRRGDTGADSFRSIFYRYFEIQGAAAAFFSKFEPHGLNLHFEILTHSRSTRYTARVRTIGADIVVFILLQMVSFAGNRSSSVWHVILLSLRVCSSYYKFYH